MAHLKQTLVTCPFMNDCYRVEAARREIYLGCNTRMRERALDLSSISHVIYNA